MIARPRAQRNAVTPTECSAAFPTILIALIDDVGPTQTDTHGGEIHTPALSNIAKEGISCNRLHTTAMCSPTRSALLTGRNHQRGGSGTITELANDRDADAGAIPKRSATVAKVLEDYGYRTTALGKWHNRPAEHTTAAGPIGYWPSGYGFECFHGSLPGSGDDCVGPPSDAGRRLVIRGPARPGDPSRPRASGSPRALRRPVISLSIHLPTTG